MDLLDYADVESTNKKKKAPSPTPAPSASTTQPTTPAVAEINMAGLSARERNMLKRKMKNDAKMNKNKDK